MPLLGSHLSIAGGYYKATNTAASLAMVTVQVFSKNNRFGHRSAGSWHASIKTRTGILDLLKMR
ncbi:MAG: hypothetical protein U0941_05185 [Planctomycetaceae bacterium]